MDVSKNRQWGQKGRGETLKPQVGKSRVGRGWVLETWDLGKKGGLR